MRPMIYTITFNPSLDYVIQVDHFKSGTINKSTFETLLAGGKGINVSTVLANLGVDNTALGFLAGFTGKEIERKLNEQGVNTSFIHVKNGLSRINVKMKSDEETEINGSGPDIRKEDIDTLFDKINQCQNEDIIVISGSIPKSLPDTIYEQIMQHLEGKEVKIVVDAKNSLVVNVLKYKPFLIKPNNYELSEIFNVTIKSKKDAITYAKKLQAMGALNVLVSMAGDGAVFVGDNGLIFESDAPKGTVVNSVGAGDSMVAGFLAKYLETNDYHQSFVYSICTGSATAFQLGLAKRNDVELIKASFLTNRI